MLLPLAKRALEPGVSAMEVLRGEGWAGVGAGAGGPVGGGAGPASTTTKGRGASRSRLAVAVPDAGAWVESSESKGVNRNTKVIEAGSSQILDGKEVEERREEDMGTGGDVGIHTSGVGAVEGMLLDFERLARSNPRAVFTSTFRPE